MNVARKFDTESSGNKEGLSVISGNGKGAAMSKSILDKLEYGKPIRQHLREFAAIFAVLGLFISGSRLIHHRPIELTAGLIIGSLLLVAIGYGAPKVLYPLWKGWMAFAHVLGAVMTSVILGVAWTLMVVPLAVCLKLFGKKVMETDFRTSSSTYWITKSSESNDFKLLERQF